MPPGRTSIKQTANVSVAADAGTVDAPRSGIVSRLHQLKAVDGRGNAFRAIAEECDATERWIGRLTRGARAGKSGEPPCQVVIEVADFATTTTAAAKRWT
jgi:hypothetical protein